MSILVDDTRWPLVLTRFDGERSMLDVESFIGQMNLVHLRKQPWASICFIKTYSRDPKVRERVAQWTKSTEAHVRANCIAVAMVSPSAGFRFVLSTIFILRRPPCPTEVCNRFADALAFVEGEAAKRNIVLPPITNPWHDVP